MAVGTEVLPAWPQGLAAAQLLGRMHIRVGALWPLDECACRQGLSNAWPTVSRRQQGAGRQLR